MPRGKAQKTLDLIDAMAEITEAAQPITVRGVAYKLFTRGLIPSMAKKETDKVSRHLTYAREQGIIPWEWIVDETHAAEYVNTWSSVLIKKSGWPSTAIAAITGRTRTTGSRYGPRRALFAVCCARSSMSLASPSG